MTPHYSDAWLDIYQGDVRDVLPELASDSVDCIVTSPPYWGLRDYGTAAWSGGDAECDHIEQYNLKRDASGGLGGGRDLGTRGVQGNTSSSKIGYRHTCGKCGAIRQDSQLGLERTPEEYVANMVAVFRELRRVLKPSGTCWLNLGDSYVANGRYDEKYEAKNPDRGALSAMDHEKHGGTGRKGYRGGGLKPKDLVGIPWRVAFALQADGWYLRSDIIWAKPNPMPESVTDRPTKAHEYLFLLTKSARYYFDADAVRERYEGDGRTRGPLGGKQAGANGNPTYSGRTWQDSEVSHRAAPGTYEAEADPANPHSARRGPKQNFDVPANGRNLRSVWTIATRPYPGAHFAVFPPELPERCIKAGSSERGVCPECGAPWERVVSERPYPKELANAVKAHGGIGNNLGGQRHQDWLEANPRQTTGWQPACLCGHLAAPVPAVVLDPFAGSGTTGMVANRLSRRAILVDLNGEYLKQQLKRNAQTPLGLAT